MHPARLALSDKAIIALRFASSGQQIIRDTELPGFFVMIGKRTKTFMAQGDLRVNGKRRSIRIKVGEVGEIKTREARAKAKELLGSIANGVDPRSKHSLGVMRKKMGSPRAAPAAPPCAPHGLGIAIHISSVKVEVRARSKTSVITWNG